MDNTLALMTESYQFIRNRAIELKSDIFQTRLLGQTTICMVGEKAKQTMDDEGHKHGKQLFISLMTPRQLQLFTFTSFTYHPFWDARFNRRIDEASIRGLFAQLA
ncbi:hypothetical protein [Planococcus shenhongbingii]|uniref:hypothetical protein n=1 Tax=Planococcus shenhongbingii TaxID=3058398 RepID=UPI0034629CDF